MSHQVKLCVTIWNEKRTACFRGETKIELPFIPILGMKLRLEGVSNALVLKDVVWSMKENIFECAVEPDCVCVFDINEDIQELTDILDPLRDLKSMGCSGLNKIWRGI